MPQRIVSTEDKTSKSNTFTNRIFSQLYGTISQALTWSAAQIWQAAATFQAAVTTLKLIVNQTGVDDIADFQDGGVSVVKVLDGGGLLLVAKAGGFTSTTTGAIGYDSTRKRLVFKHADHPGSVPVDPRNTFINVRISGTY